MAIVYNHIMAHCLQQHYDILITTEYIIYDYSELFTTTLLSFTHTVYSNLMILYIYLFYLFNIWFYIPPSRANTSERAGA